MRTFVVLALSVMMACEDPFTAGRPVDYPGVAVPGLTRACQIPFGGCSVWSADSRTLYIVAAIGTPGVASLVAVDPLTLGFRIVGSIDASATNLALSADGASVYFGVLDSTTGGAWIITRMALSDGSTTALTRTRFLNFLVSPHGTTLAYHAFGTPTSRDTVVVLDLPSATRRATFVGSQSLLEAFSADGTRLLIDQALNGGRAVLILHVDTGARDTIPIPRGNGAVNGVAWSGDNFRMLFAGTGGRTFTDTSLAGGSAIAYVVGQRPGQILWLPDLSAIWTVPVNDICGPRDCNSFRFDFVYATATKALTVGAARSRFPMQVTASPDGRWLAYTEDFGNLYLLNRPTP